MSSGTAKYWQSMAIRKRVILAMSRTWGGDENM
jgi:hypothetical protein